MPVILVHSLSRVSRLAPIDDADLKPMLSCYMCLPVDEPDEFEPEQDDFIIDPCVHDKPDCTNNKRCCALYGILIPVNK